MGEYFWEAAKLLHDRRKADADLAQHTSEGILGRRWLAASYPDRHYWQKAEEWLVGGCGLPDRPIELSRDEACMLNFGTSPEILTADTLITEAEKQGQTVTMQGRPVVPESMKKDSQDLLKKLESNYAESQSQDGVYNLEPWLQEVYRDILDFDRREALKQRVDMLDSDMGAVPGRLLALGLPQIIVNDVMTALKAFNTIQDQSKAREKQKTSVSSAREYAKVTTLIQSTMERAQMHIPGARTGKQSALGDLYNAWKEATYELIELKTQLNRVWIGSALDNQVNQLTGALRALRETLVRCAEDAEVPQCSLLGAPEVPRLISRRLIVQTLQMIRMHDLMAVTDASAERMEYRRFGPLCAIIAPGEGSPRFSHELRKYFTSLAEAEKEFDRKEFDLDRRVDYPLNYLIIPGLTDQKASLETITDAYYEYKQSAFPNAYRATLDELKRLMPAAFDNVSEPGAKNPLRARLSRYTASFIRWTHTGAVEPLPAMREFIDWGSEQLQGRAIIMYPRHRCIVMDFREGSGLRRKKVYQLRSGGRMDVNNQQLAVYVLARNVEAALQATISLPSESRENPALKKAVEVYQARGVNYITAAISHLRRFMLSDTEMGRSLLSLEARFSAEVGAMRDRSFRTLGKDLPFAQAMELLTKRHAKQLLEKRQEINDCIDRDLLGLLYATEGNYIAALDELDSHLKRMTGDRKQRRRDTEKLSVGAVLVELGQRGKKLGKIAAPALGGQTRVSGDSSPPMTAEDDFVFYNMASIARMLRKRDMAKELYRRFADYARKTGLKLYADFALAIIDEMEAEEQAAREEATKAAEA